jgi:endo-1,4-beta-xylanase
VHDLPLSRRSFLAGVAATVLAACSPALRRGKPTSSATASLTPSPVDCEFPEAVGPGAPLWETALQRGVVYGSSTATWQISDGEYRRLFAREASILFTEDDMLWYRLRPSPKSGLDFRYSDRIVDFAENQGMLVFGAHLAWDEGFGEGWTQSDLTGLSGKEARRLLFGTIDRLVHRYRGRVAAWSAVNDRVLRLAHDPEASLKAPPPSGSTWNPSASPRRDGRASVES